MVDILKAVVDEISDNLDSALDGYVEFNYGRTSKKTGRPYSVQFIPDSFTLAGPKRIGGQNVPGLTAKQLATTVYDDLQVMTIKVWGPDYEGTYTLAHDIIVAARNARNNLVQFGPGNWITDNSVGKFGEHIEFSMTVSIPVINEILPLSPLLGESHITSWQFPNQTEDGYC